MTSLNLAAVWSQAVVSPGGIIILSMKARVFVPVIAIMLLVVIALVTYAWKATPQLLAISPRDGSENVSAVTSIRLAFSRPMQPDSVTARLSINPAVPGITSWDGNSLVFTPNQPWPVGVSIQVSLGNGAHAASWLAFPMDGQSWTFAVSSTALAYLWPSTGPADIYTLDPATGDIHQYTQAMNVLDYTASRDGRWFYFDAGNSLGGADLYALDRIRAVSSPGKSSSPQKLLDCGAAQCRNLAISPDGETLAYEYLLPDPQGGTAPAQVWALQLPDLVTAQIGAAGHETVQPAWSATGQLAYYDRTGSDYEVYDPLSKERIQLPNQTGQPGDWSHDGKTYLAPEISYQPSGQGSEMGSSHLYLYDIAAHTSTDLSGAGTVEDVEAVYSPEGSMIAFTRKYLDAARWSLGRQVWVMGADGSRAHAITSEPDYNHYDLAWSRDGSRLAYVRFNQVKISDPPELWMINLDGSQPVQLVIGGYSPVWIP